MQRYVQITKSLGDSQHYCRCSLSNEQFFARMGGEDLVRFRDTDGMSSYPDACPFLRPEGEGQFICTIYQARPRHCRDFICKRT